LQADDIIASQFEHKAPISNIEKTKIPIPARKYSKQHEKL
jgi:hypothetical protein